jgi:hypothetical protein
VTSQIVPRSSWTAAGRRLLHFGLGSGTGPRGLLVQFGHEGWLHACSGIRIALWIAEIHCSAESPACRTSVMIQSSTYALAMVAARRVPMRSRRPGSLQKRLTLAVAPKTITSGSHNGLGRARNINIQSPGFSKLTHLYKIPAFSLLLLLIIGPLLTSSEPLIPLSLSGRMAC